MAITVGYTNASWTLKADLVSEFVCRVLNHMDANGYDTVVPQHPGNSVDERPFMDFTPGYILRVLHVLPKQGSRAPWRLSTITCWTSPDPARQDRRRGPAVHQTPCASGGFGLVTASRSRAISLALRAAGAPTISHRHPAVRGSSVAWVIHRSVFIHKITLWRR